jgi:hypothetical protein
MTAITDEAQSPQLQVYAFTLGAGEVVVRGKPHWPDLVRLRIPKAKALNFAMEVLRFLQMAQPDEEFLLDVAILGKLEALGLAEQ